MSVIIHHGYRPKQMKWMNVELAADGTIDVNGMASKRGKDQREVWLNLTGPEALWLAQQLLSELHKRDGACPTISVNKES